MHSFKTMSDKPRYFEDKVPQSFDQIEKWALKRVGNDKEKKKLETVFAALNKSMVKGRRDLFLAITSNEKIDGEMLSTALLSRFTEQFHPKSTSNHSRAMEPIQEEPADFKVDESRQPKLHELSGTKSSVSFVETNLKKPIPAEPSRRSTSFSSSSGSSSSCCSTVSSSSLSSSCSSSSNSSSSLTLSGPSNLSSVASFENNKKATTKLAAKSMFIYVSDPEEINEDEALNSRGFENTNIRNQRLLLNVEVSGPEEYTDAEEPVDNDSFAANQERKKARLIAECYANTAKRIPDLQSYATGSKFLSDFVVNYYTKTTRQINAARKKNYITSPRNSSKIQNPCKPMLVPPEATAKAKKRTRGKPNTSSESEWEVKKVVQKGSSKSKKLHKRKNLIRRYTGSDSDEYDYDHFPEADYVRLKTSPCLYPGVIVSDPESASDGENVVIQNERSKTWGEMAFDTGISGLESGLSTPPSPINDALPENKFQVYGKIYTPDNEEGISRLVNVSPPESFCSKVEDVPLAPQQVFRTNVLVSPPQFYSDVEIEEQNFTKNQTNVASVLISDPEEIGDSEDSTASGFKQRTKRSIKVRNKISKVNVEVSSPDEIDDDEPRRPLSRKKRPNTAPRGYHRTSSKSIREKLSMGIVPAISTPAALLERPQGKPKAVYRKPKNVAKRGTGQFQCTLCPQRFTCPKNLNRHLKTAKIHNPIFTRCSHCPSVFESKRGLAKHLAMHLPTHKDFFCPHCGLQFRSEQGLFSHIQRKCDLDPNNNTKNRSQKEAEQLSCGESSPDDE